MTPELSIIICTRNRAAQLERCLESIRRQTLPRDRFEVMVVDNGSTDATRAVAGDPGIRYLYEPVAGVSQARNTGWRAARGRYVGYLDDDATAAPAWAENAMTAFQRAKNPPACVSGPIEIQSDTAMPAWINAPLRAYLGEVDLGKTAKDIDDPLTSIGGGNLFFQRTILEHMHGFDIRLGRKGKQLRSGEETELLSRIFATGGFIAYHPEVKIIHHIAPDRLKPAWFYRLNFGIGHAMGRIRQSAARTQSAAPAGMPGLTRAGGRRAAGHLLPALGLSRRRTAIIHGRIYFAFVLGWLAALRPFRLPHTCGSGTGARRMYRRPDPPVR